MITPFEVQEACEKNGIVIKPVDSIDIAENVNNDIDFLNYVHETIIEKTVEFLRL